MDEFSFSLPETNLAFGEGALDGLGKMAKSLGSSALLVTGKSSMRKLGFLQRAVDLLRNAGLGVAVFDGVQPNPTIKKVAEGIALGMENECDVVVAIGGGSSIDAAKAMAVGIGQKDANIWPYVLGRRQPTERTLPIIAVPSTSGTGSHVTWYSVLTNQETNEKGAFSSKHIYPKESIVDLGIVSKMPAGLTAETGFDALAHCMESYVSNIASPITRILSLRGISLIAKNLQKAFRHGEDLEARCNMALADTYAGMSITAARTIMVHGIGNTVSGMYPRISHGQALACLTPHVMRFNIEEGDKKTVADYCDIAAALGEDISKRDKESAMRSVEAVVNLQKKTGLLKTLVECGVEEDSIGVMADYSMALGRGALSCNPVVVGREDVMRIYREAL